jgi:[protein-PII] uridylyltransferase
VSLRARRQTLVERTDLRGDAFCRAYAEAADEWLTGLFDEAAAGDAKGMALLAVGGYGRGELCPFSDLDVVLLHRGRRDISATADRIWYPVWDEGISLDHSVRRPNEALDMAAEDLRVALGLLDARVICGDPKVAEPVLEGARDRWVKQKPPWLGVLSDLVAERHRASGDVGFLLEPDLKESHGGLRDIAALTALMQAVPVLADYVDTMAIDEARAVLTTIRVELHRRAGRDLNKLLLQEQDEVAKALGEPDADSLMLDVATAGRTVAWEGDDAWRRRGPGPAAVGGAAAKRPPFPSPRCQTTPASASPTKRSSSPPPPTSAGTLRSRSAWRRWPPRRTCPSRGTRSTCSGARRPPRPCPGRTTSGPR